MARDGQSQICQTDRQTERVIDRQTHRLIDSYIIPIKVTYPVLTVLYTGTAVQQYEHGIYVLSVLSRLLALGTFVKSPLGADVQFNLEPGVR